MNCTPDTLIERVDQAINNNPYLMRHKVHLETRSGVVVLQGVVPSYFQKQMAQEALRHVEGVQAVENRLEVHWS